MKRLIALFASSALAFSAMTAPAFANPIPYVNSPVDTPQALANGIIANVNNNLPATQYTSLCSGTTTATCTGLRNLVSITGLTTAAGAVSAAMTVTNTSVTAASQVNCQVIQYGGTGIPNAVIVTAAAGSYSFEIQNSAASAALNATVATVCFVYN